MPFKPLILWRFLHQIARVNHDKMGGLMADILMDFSQSLLAPCASGEKYQNWEDLQTAGQHIHRQHQLAEITEAGEIAGGTHCFQSGTDVVEASQNGSQICSHGEVV